MSQPAGGSIRARREAHEEMLPNVRWYSVSELAARWRLDPETVKAIPYNELRWKDFAKPGARRAAISAPVGAFCHVPCREMGRVVGHIRPALVLIDGGAPATEAATLRALLHPLPQVWAWVRGGDAA